MKYYPILPLLLSLAAFDVAAGEQLEHILVTATQRPVNSLQLPMNSAVISSDDLDMVSEVHVSEVFQRVPGAWISRGNGQESLTALRSPVLTGPGSCGAFFMAGDGVSLRAPGFCNVNQLFDANVEQAARVEVIKGPATALYGSGAMHGVINVISPEPSENTEQRIGIEGGPHDYYRGKYLYSDTVGRHGFLLAVNAASDGGYKRSSGYDQQKTTLRYRYDGDGFDSDTIFTATNLKQDTAGFIEGYKAYQDSDLKKDNPNPNAYRDAWSVRMQSTFDIDIDELDQLSITPYWRNNEMEFLQHFVPWEPVEENGQTSYGVNTRLYKSLSWTDVASGLDIDYTDGWLQEVQDQPFSPNQPAGVHYDYQVDAITAALWSQLSWDLARNWSINAGVRYEYTRYDYDNRAGDGSACAPTASACRFYRPTDRDDDFNNLSFNAGLLYDYNPGHAVYLRVASGFRAPQATELYRLQGGQEQADLDSEELDSIELGWRGVQGELEYDLGAYYTEKDHVIFQDADRRNVSNAATRHYGLDFSVRWQFATNFDLAIDGTLARHEYDNDVRLLGTSGDIKGNVMDTAPELFGSVRGGWNFLPGYRAELEWIHMDEYFLEPDNRHQYDGHDLLNLRVRGQLSKRITLGVRATNLMDEDYAERADFGFGQYRYFVGEPRSLYLQLEYQLTP